MGLKMNKFGLMYNDKNTSSFGTDFEINIQTNGGGKFHQVKCVFCGRKNNIDLAVIKQRLEIDKDKVRDRFHNNNVSDEDKYIDNAKGSMLSFRCGACGMPVSTTISKSDIEIYEVNEYQKEVAKVVNSIGDKEKSGKVNRVSKQQYETERKRD